MKTLTRLILAVVYTVAILVVPVRGVRAEEAAADQETLDQLDALLSTAGDAETVAPDALTQLNGLQDRLQNLQQKLANRDQALIASAGELAEAEARLKNLRDENQILKSELENQYQRVAKAEAEHRQAQTDFERLFKEEAVSSGRDPENARQAAEIERLKGELAATQVALEDASSHESAPDGTDSARLARMDKALTEAQAREEEYKELIERLVPQVAALEQEVTALTQDRQELGNRLLQRDEVLQALKVELERREHRLAKSQRVGDVLEKARTEVLRAGEREKLNMYYNMASVFAREGKFAEAENEYLRILRIAPTDADVHYNLGILYDDEMKQPDKAMVHYRRYLQINPQGPDAGNVRNWLKKLEMQAQR